MRIRQRVYDYVENCIEIANISIKMHKRSLGFCETYWLDDAEKYTEEAEKALKYNMLPSEAKGDF